MSNILIDNAIMGINNIEDNKIKGGKEFQFDPIDLLF